jgi:ATP-dependent DNA ligase
MELEKIYKLDATGNIRVWWAEVGEGEYEGSWRTHHGHLRGEITTSGWTYTEAKRQLTAKAQSLFCAKAEMEKKLKLDYRASIDNVNEKRYSLIKPMLAYDYYDWPGPCFVQPKLDGMRCIANKDGLWTRINRKIISVPHIERALKAFFHSWPNIVLDGELYNHRLRDNFNLIMSMTKKTTGLTPTDLMKSEEMIQFWIFDMFDLDNPKAIFEERMDFLVDNLFDIYLHDKIIKTQTRFVKTQDELDIYNIQLLEHGYEGQMVRLNVSYQQKRTDKLLKRKEFQDKEFELVEIQEGAGSWEGFAKIAVCRLENGKTFGAGIAGDQEFCYRLLKEKGKYRSVTVKYQMLTPDGVPRFPIATKFYEEMFDGMEEIIKPKKDLFA